MRHHDVGRRYVTVDHALGMRITEGCQHLGRIAEPVLQENMALFRAIEKRYALDEFHNHHQLVIYLESAVELRDIWMVQPRQCANLGDKTFTQLSICSDVGEQNFYGFDAIGNDVSSPVNLTHSALSEHPEYFVVACELAYV